MENVMRGSGQTKLALCTCGKLHLTYGAVTLHFDRDEFLLFAESVGRMSAIARQVPGPVLTSSLTPNANICH